MNSTETAILQWLSDSAYGEAGRTVIWLFPMLETIHFLGVCLLLGSLLVLELRLVGFAPNIPIKPAFKFIPIAIFGFLLCMVSGIGFLCTDPFNYWSNPAFKIKMLMVVIAGINAVLFEFVERRKAGALPDGARTDVLTKVFAGASLLIWLSVICLGRLLPYLGGTGG